MINALAFSGFKWRLYPFLSIKMPDLIFIFGQFNPSDFSIHPIEKSAHV